MRKRQREKEGRKMTMNYPIYWIFCFLAWVMVAKRLVLEAAWYIHGTNKGLKYVHCIQFSILVRIKKAQQFFLIQ